METEHVDAAEACTRMIRSQIAARGVRNPRILEAMDGPPLVVPEPLSAGPLERYDWPTRWSRRRRSSLFSVLVGVHIATIYILYRLIFGY